MGGLYSRVKTWSSTEDVTSVDLNAEFDNILNNFVPLMLDDYSLDVTQMQVQTDAGEVGTESKATTLAGEIACLRFAINEIKGTTYWYTSASSSISELASALGSALLPNRISSGRIRTGSSQSIFLVPNGSALTVTCKGATTNLVYYIRGTQYTISSDVTNTSLVAAPSSNNTCAVNYTGLAGQAFSKTLGEYGSTIPIKTIGSELSALNGKICGFKTGTEYFIGRMNSTNSVIEHCRRGYFFDSSDSPLPRVTLTDSDTITLMKLAWIYVNTAGAIAVGYTNPYITSDQPTSPSVGDYWFDTTVGYWKYFDSITWSAANVTLVGISLQNTTACVATRSFDLYKAFSSVNNIVLENISVTQTKTKNSHCEANVFGSSVRFQEAYASWDITANLDSGITEAANTTYYYYLTETGKCVISDVIPMDFREVRKGLYHPHQTWLCVGQMDNDNGSDLHALIDYQAGDRYNYAIVNYVSANALNIKVVTSPMNKFHFRNSTAATGEQALRYLSAGPTLAVSSTATLGHISGQNQYIYVYLLDFATGMELAVATYKLDEGTLQTTTAMSGSATSKLTPYSATARSSVAVKLIARLKSNQVTAGTWALVPTEISLVPFDIPPTRSQLKYNTGVGHGAVNTKIRRIETIDSTATYNASTDITFASTVNAGTTFTINTDGLYAISYQDQKTSNNASLGISRNSAQLTTNIETITAANNLSSGWMPAANQTGFVSWTGYLDAGDVIRPHTNGTPDTATSIVAITVTKVSN